MDNSANCAACCCDASKDVTLTEDSSGTHAAAPAVGATPQWVGINYDAMESAASVPQDLQRYGSREAGYYNRTSYPEGEYRVERLEDGSTFEGQFRGRDRHGWGKLTWPTGASGTWPSFYEGQFDSNIMHGEGTYSWNDGSTYDGSTHVLLDVGAMRWDDGRRYEGQFHEGKKHGEGQLMWPRHWENGKWENRSYHGQWENGKQHGLGILVIGKNGDPARPHKTQWDQGKLTRWLDGEARAGAPDVGGTPIKKR